MQASGGMAPVRPCGSRPSCHPSRASLGPRPDCCSTAWHAPRREPGGFGDTAAWLASLGPSKEQPKDWAGDSDPQTSGPAPPAQFSLESGHADILVPRESGLAAPGSGRAGT